MFVVLTLVPACGTDGVVSTPDASSDGALPDGDPSPDAGLIVDPLSVAFRAVDAPASGPLGIWAPLVARIDDDRSLLFGGTNAGTTSGSTFGGTWLYDARSGVLEAIEIADDGPAPRYCGCAGWDPERERLILTGGRELSLPLSLPAETWELDLAAGTWTQVDVPESPDAVIGCMLAYAPATRALYHFGGAGAEGASGAIRRYDPEMPGWVVLDATGPSPRYDGYFEATDEQTLLLFGGSYSAMGAAFFSDVWRFDAVTESWSEVAIDGVVPAGRRVPWALLHEDRQGLYVAMGFDGRMQPIGDFWYLDLEARRWTELALPAALGARAFTATLPASAPALGSMLGGYDGSGPVSEVWTLAHDDGSGP
jgi:hypothetical protein